MRARGLEVNDREGLGEQPVGALHAREWKCRITSYNVCYTKLLRIVEIKPAQPALAQTLCTLIRRARMTSRVLVASMHAADLDAFRRACPEVATSMGPEEARLFYFASLVRLSAALSPDAQALQIPYALGEHVLATARLVGAAHARNLKLHVWTLNDEARMRRALALGVDGIMTDRNNFV